MVKVTIIGGGFAGLAAASLLAKEAGKIDVTLFDKKETADFLPLLPDTIGRGIPPDLLTYDIARFAKALGIKFILSEVTALDLRGKNVITGTRDFSYDHLIIACGSETNFYGNENIKAQALKLDSSSDALKIISALKEKEFRSYVISGGGYTGIEAATNIRVFLNKFKKQGRVIIVERAPSILGPLPAWMREYVGDNLKKMDIELFTNSAIEKIELGKISISGNRAFEQSLLVWAAGVKTPVFIQDLKLEKNPQGRIKVDQYLKVADDCFVVGDAANFQYQNAFLRMGVQFALTQGAAAAENILRSVKGINLSKYQPVDLGFIIPMANNRSCGNILGMKLRGILPTWMHFLMCIYRSYGMKNKMGILSTLTRGGAG